jgi:integrase
MIGAAATEEGLPGGLTRTLDEALRRAVRPGCRGRHPSPLTEELPRLQVFLQPALRALDAHGYSLGVTRIQVLRAVCQGALLVGRPPEQWTIEEWRHIRRWYGGDNGLALTLVAVRGYGIASSEPLHPLFRECHRAPLAFRLFGQEAVRGAHARLRDAMMSLGYRDAGTSYIIPRCVAELLVWHGKPDLDMVTDESIARFVDDKPTTSTLSALHGVSMGLVRLGILTKPVDYSRRPERVQSAMVGPGRDRPDIASCPAEWLAWADRWFSQSDLALETRRTVRSVLVVAGRWLAREHPSVTMPSQWTLDIAHSWIKHVCERTAGEGVPPGRLIPNFGQPIAPTSKSKFIFGVRSFFRDILDWEWIERKFNPLRAFRLPKQIRRAVGPNPRPLDDAVWLKLRAAALTLGPQDLPPGPRGRSSLLPLPMVQAVAAAWTFSGCRSSEIHRLGLDCTYYEDVPEQTDPVSGEVLPAFRQAMLRVPANKTSGEFVKPIEGPLAEAIERWRQARQQQPRSVDRVTQRQTDYLFCNRGRMLSRTFLNRTLIPILLNKAGLDARDSRGAITSHRARTTLATKLYSPKSGMAAVEVMKWLGHTDLATGRYYVELTPMRLMTAFHRSVALSDNLRLVGVLADTNPGPGEPVLRYDLGHGWCTNPAYAMCAHRMACARCSFYEPAAAMRERLEQQSGRYLHLLHELRLADDEQAAVSGDREAVQRLLKRLQREPTPGTPDFEQAEQPHPPAN